ncbi:hypothetical protein [Candidatus Cardinium hertigii]|uniref:Uncharacterized protein n=1 Tax=Candidatus Cardinium hertigii TaxID=247481 RepID=A0A2Z3L8V5_9BACT|nr:hypothetical protein [Candidatus Cardinium hertigii]AWN81998.1 hypothetical protein DK880_00687 [Candidatus Cardinium hertigii]
MQIKKISFLSVLYYMSILFPIYHAIGREDFINWRDYLCHCPDYKKHQEPVDIAVNGCKWGTCIHFSNKVLAIEAKVGSWKEPEDLFQSQDFAAIYNHPCYYWKNAIAYLSDSNHSEKQKKIAIYGLEKLGEDHYLSFAKACYKLYKQKLFSDSLFQMVLCFEFLRIHPLVIGYQNGAIESFLKRVQLEIGTTTPIALQIKRILSGELLKEWKKKGLSTYYNYRYPIPIPEIIHKANREQKRLRPDFYGGSMPHPNYIPDFLMILDHPDYYYETGIEGSKDDAIGFITDASHNEEEKRLVVFAMHQLSPEAYAHFIRSVCGAYYWGHVSVRLMEDLLHCNRSCSTRFKYPFFILDYRKECVQCALDEFIALPTLPCGLKEMAKKIKTGKLATPEEIVYMEGYRKFRETHFTLYETIPPRKRSC